MLRIINIKADGDQLYMEVLIEDNGNERYGLCVDKSSDMYPVISSQIPEKYKIYERQARMALRKYIGKELPETVISCWC